MDNLIQLITLLSKIVSFYSFWPDFTSIKGPLPPTYKHCVMGFIIMGEKLYYVLTFEKLAR